MLHSTTSKGRSRIRARLTEGSVVTTLKNTVDNVVTEHGIARLRGASLAERARRLIAVADPAHRESSSARRTRPGCCGAGRRPPPGTAAGSGVIQPVDVALRDGSTVRVREVRAADVDGLRELLAGMSENSRWLRFLSSGVDLDRMAGRGGDARTASGWS